MATRKTTDKPTLSDAQLASKFIVLLDKGETPKEHFYRLLTTEYAIDKGRFYKILRETYERWRNLKENAENNITHANTVECLKSGLKSKIERIADLQKMLEEDYLHEETVLNITNGRQFNYYRKLQPKEITNIHAEISKMQGDYAPAKVAQTDTKGDDVEPSIIVWGGVEIKV